jgi:hypothetical protein
MLEAVRNVMAHGDAWERKWRGNRRLETVATTLALCLGTWSIHCALIHTPRLPAVDWTDSPADLNGLVHFSERPNLASARVPSRFKRALPLYEAGLTVVSVFQTVFRRTLGHGESLDDSEIFHVRLLRCSAAYLPLPKRMHLTCRAWLESLKTRDDGQSENL